MQRHFYPFALLTAFALAGAVVLRPGAARDLIALAGYHPGTEARAAEVAPGGYVAPYGIMPQRPATPVAAQRPNSWPGAPVPAMPPAFSPDAPAFPPVETNGPPAAPSSPMQPEGPPTVHQLPPPPGAGRPARLFGPPPFVPPGRGDGPGTGNDPAPFETALPGSPASPSPMTTPPRQSPQIARRDLLPPPPVQDAESVAGDYYRERYSRPAERAVRPEPMVGPYGDQRPVRVASLPGPSRPAGPPPWSVCESAVVLAQTGSDVVLASDVIAGLDAFIDGLKRRVPPDEVEAQRESIGREVAQAIDEAITRTRTPPDSLLPSERQRLLLLRELLKQQIQTKLIYEDAGRKIPAEGLPQIEKQLDKQFEETELKALMKNYKVESRRELDEALKARGSSLEWEKRSFREKMVAHQWLRQQAEVDEEADYNEMLAYYDVHRDEFDKPARTIWEEIVVTFATYPDKAEARRAIAEMGNRLVDGADFAEVAKEGSEGITAAEGGRREWPDGSQYLPEVVRRAIDGLPAGALSPIIEDVQGCYIVRVVERKPAGLVPFTEAQDELREKVHDQRVNERITQYLTRLEEHAPVWTILDADLARLRQEK